MTEQQKQNKNKYKTTTIKQQQQQQQETWIFNKDDICKEFCAALYTLEEVMSQLRIKSGRSGRQVWQQVCQAGRSGRQVRQIGQVDRKGRSGWSGMQVWPVVEEVMSQLKKGRGYVTIEERKRLCHN